MVWELLNFEIFFCHWKFNKFKNKFYHPSPHSTLIFTCYWMFPRQVTRFPTLYPMVQMKYSKSLTFMLWVGPMQQILPKWRFQTWELCASKLPYSKWGKQAIMCWDQSSNARESFYLKRLNLTPSSSCGHFK